MSGCVNHLEKGVCDPNCPERYRCHDFSGWRLSDGRRVIFHTCKVVSELVYGGVNDPNVDYGIVVGRNNFGDKYTEIIPAGVLRRG